MNELLKVSIYGLLVGVVGTSFGGMLTFFINSRGKRFLSSILEFSAGLMLAIVLVELVPEAFESGSLATVLIGIFAGVFCMSVTEEIILNHKKASHTESNKLFKTGMALAIGIALHNLPEGIAVGSSFNASEFLGISLALAILIHNVPEGMAVSIPLKTSGFSKAKILLVTALTGLPTAVGAYIGCALGDISPWTLSICFAFAAGAMLYVTIADMIPNSKEMYGGRMPSYFNILGVIIGIIISHCL